MSHPMDSVLFISLSDSNAVAEKVPGFDSSIPLPVQLSAPAATFTPADLTIEMILAGMLTVFAWDSENDHLDYYRSLLLALKPDICRELTDAAILKARNGEWELAEEIFMALYGLEPDNAVTALNLALLQDERADALRQSGLDEEAEALDGEAFRWYRMAMTAEPPMADAFFNAGFFYSKQRNYRKAREALETYLSLETGDSEQIRFRKEKARQIVAGISARDLDDDLFKEAYDAISMGNEEAALEKIHLFLEHHPSVWNGWFLLGWALRRLNRWEDARAAFVQALELGNKEGSEIESGYTDICNELAICFMELGNLDESRRWLVSALEREGENTKIISNLGMVALKAGNKEEAAGYFRTVLEIDSRDQFARTMLEQITE